MDYGYARVSTRKQELDRQLDALAAAGIAPSATFVDKKTGKDVDREGLTALLAVAGPGDSITVSTLDRLGRNITDVLVLVRDLTAAEVRLRSLHDPIPIDTADTSIMAQISMKLLALFADMERIFMLERVHDARAAKAKRGKRSGPKPKLTPAQRRALAALMADTERASTAGELAAGFGISRATLYRETGQGEGLQDHSHPRCIVHLNPPSDNRQYFAAGRMDPNTGPGSARRIRRGCVCFGGCWSVLVNVFQGSWLWWG